MPSKKKFNARFPPARIKRIMQADEEVGKVAAVVPVIISRTLEIFVETLLKKASDVTRSRNARTLTPAHLKASINAESQFSFLREMVATIPDIQLANEDDAPEAPSSTTNISNPRGNRRSVITRCPPQANIKSKGRPRKTGGSRPRVVSQDDSEEEEDDIEESDEEEEGETESSIVVPENRVVMESSNRPALVVDQVPLPVVDDDYDNV